MRHQPIEATAWEIEAARRREVIEADFAAAHERREDRESRDGARTGRVGRIAGWIAAVRRVDNSPSSHLVDRASGCQPGVRATEPGS
jgi:hypothetical protein